MRSRLEMGQALPAVVYICLAAVVLLSFSPTHASNSTLCGSSNSTANGTVTNATACANSTNTTTSTPADDSTPGVDPYADAHLFPLGHWKRPVRHCALLQRTIAGAASGTYWVQPDATQPAFPTWCDMSYDEGGWMRIVMYGATSTPVDQLLFWPTGDANLVAPGERAHNYTLSETDLLSRTFMYKGSLVEFEDAREAISSRNATVWGRALTAAQIDGVRTAYAYQDRLLAAPKYSDVAPCRTVYADTDTVNSCCCKYTPEVAAVTPNSNFTAGWQQDVFAPSKCSAGTGALSSAKGSHVCGINGGGNPGGDPDGAHYAELWVRDERPSCVAPCVMYEDVVPLPHQPRDAQHERTADAQEAALTALDGLQHPAVATYTLPTANGTTGASAIVIGGVPAGRTSATLDVYRYNGTAAEWEPLVPLQPGHASEPYGRKYGLAVYDEQRGVVVVVGGHRSAGYLGDVFVLDFFENLWRFTVPGAAQFNGPSPRILSGAIHDRELWVFGGTISLFTEGSAEALNGFQVGTTSKLTSIGAGNTREALFDDDRTTGVVTEAAAAQESVVFIFDNAVTVAAIHVSPLVSSGIDASALNGRLVQYSRNGYQFETVATISGISNTDTRVVLRFPPVSAGWWRIAAPGPLLRVALAYLRFDDMAFLTDTYALNLDTYVWRTPTTAQVAPPPGRVGHVMATSNAVLDGECAQRAVWVWGGLFRARVWPAGTIETTFLNDLWALDLHDEVWTHVTQRGDIPTPRTGGTMTYSATAHALFLFGGHDANGVLLDRVQRLDLRTLTWRHMQTLERYPRQAGTRLPAHNWLFGAVHPSEPTFSVVASRVAIRTNYTAAWRRTEELLASNSSAYPPALCTACLAPTYRRDDRKCYTSCPNAWYPREEPQRKCVASALTWRAAATGGSLPSPRNCASMVVDAARRRAVLFGGNAFDRATYSLNLRSMVWQVASSSVDSDYTPLGRRCAAMAIDTPNDRVVLFGGQTSDDSVLLNTLDVLDLATMTWTAVAQPAGSSWPSARYGAAAVYDSVNKQVILFGGKDTSDQLLNEVWVLHANLTWSYIAAAAVNAPSPRIAGVVAFDGVTGSVIVHSAGWGTVDTATYVLDTTTWVWDRPLSALPGPSQRVRVAGALDEASRTLVMVGGQNCPTYTCSGTHVLHLDTMTWTFPAQSQSNQPSPERFLYTMSFDPVYRRTLLFGGGFDPQNYNDVYYFETKPPCAIAGCEVCDPVTSECRMCEYPLWAQGGRSSLNPARHGDSSCVSQCDRHEQLDPTYGVCVECDKRCASTHGLLLDGRCSCAQCSYVLSVIDRMKTKLYVDENVPPGTLVPPLLMPALPALLPPGSEAPQDPSTNATANATAGNGMGGGMVNSTNATVTVCTTTIVGSWVNCTVAGTSNCTADGLMQVNCSVAELNATNSSVCSADGYKWINCTAAGAGDVNATTNSSCGADGLMWVNETVTNCSTVVQLPDNSTASAVNATTNSSSVANSTTGSSDDGQAAADVFDPDDWYGYNAWLRWSISTPDMSIFASDTFGNVSYTGAQPLDYEVDAGPYELAYNMTYAPSGMLSKAVCWMQVPVDVIVNDINDPPVFKTVYNLALDFNAGMGAHVDYVLSTDEDTRETLSYRIVANSSMELFEFDIDNATAALYVKSVNETAAEHWVMPVNATTLNHSLVVEVTDQAGAKDYTTVRINMRCPGLTPFIDWLPCTVQCGGGHEARGRWLLPQNHSRNGFPIVERFGCGEYVQHRPCNMEACPYSSTWWLGVILVVLTLAGLVASKVVRFVFGHEGKRGGSRVSNAGRSNKRKAGRGRIVRSSRGGCCPPLHTSGSLYDVVLFGQGIAMVLQLNIVTPTAYDEFVTRVAWLWLPPRPAFFTRWMGLLYDAFFGAVADTLGAVGVEDRGEAAPGTTASVVQAVAYAGHGRSLALDAMGKAENGTAHYAIGVARFSNDVLDIPPRELFFMVIVNLVAVTIIILVLACCVDLFVVKGLKLQQVLCCKKQKGNVHVTSKWGTATMVRAKLRRQQMYLPQRIRAALWFIFVAFGNTISVSAGLHIQSEILRGTEQLNFGSWMLFGLAGLALLWCGPLAFYNAWSKARWMNQVTAMTKPKILAQYGPLFARYPKFRYFGIYDALLTMSTTAVILTLSEFPFFQVLGLMVTQFLYIIMLLVHTPYKEKSHSYAFALACVVRTISYGILLVFLDHTGESPENNISVALAVYFSVAFQGIVLVFFIALFARRTLVRCSYHLYRWNKERRRAKRRAKARDAQRGRHFKGPDQDTGAAAAVSMSVELTKHESSSSSSDSDSGHGNRKRAAKMVVGADGGFHGANPMARRRDMEFDDQYFSRGSGDEGEFSAKNPMLPAGKGGRRPRRGRRQPGGKPRSAGAGTGGRSPRAATLAPHQLAMLRKQQKTGRLSQQESALLKEHERETAEAAKRAAARAAKRQRRQKSRESRAAVLADDEEGGGGGAAV